MSKLFSLLMLVIGVVAPAYAKNYTAEKTTDHGVDIVRLTDAKSGVVVSIVPSVGNRCYEMKVHGQNVLWFPNDDVSAWVKRPQLGGVPLLAPWADILDEPAFYANGKKYSFNMSLGNVRSPIPGAGFLSTSPFWEVTEVAADGKSAHVTSRLQVWKNPEYMAQWPFAQEYEQTYSLSGGVLQMKMTIRNLSRDPMPISIGFHTFYQIPGVPRDQWTAHFPARSHVVADAHKLSTGELKPTGLPDPLPLTGAAGGPALPDAFTSQDDWRTNKPWVGFDDGFTDFNREADGNAHFWIQAGDKKVEAIFGPKFQVATIWLPPNQPYIAMESLTALINGLNLAGRGKYPALQYLPAGQTWTESFWIKATGI